MTYELMPLTPITMVGGFLGAGKTTLVNHMLSNVCGMRVVVFVNDFGAINLDYDLIDTLEENRVSLKNGCVCCTLNEDLIADITRYAREQNPPDAIIIETSGVASPINLEQSIDKLEEASIATLESRVYVLDTASFSELCFEDQEDIIDHCASSDLVLLNKSDIASDRQIGDISTLLAESAPYTSLVETANCKLPFELLQYGGVESDRPGNQQKPDSSGQQAIHSDKWASWQAQTRQVVERARFQKFAEALKQRCYRAKGNIHFTDDPKSQFRFNLVGSRLSLEKSPIDNAKKETVLVAIGKKTELLPDQLNALFNDLLIKGDSID